MSQRILKTLFSTKKHEFYLKGIGMKKRKKFEGFYMDAEL